MLKILNLAYINRVKKLLNSQWWRFSGLPNISIFTEFKQQILRDFFFFFGCAGSLLLRGLFFSYGEWGLVFSCGVWAPQCSGFSCGRAMGPRCAGFGSRGTQAPELQFSGSRAQAQQLRHTGLAAPRHAGSSWVRDWAQVSCTAGGFFATAAQVQIYVMF